MISLNHFFVSQLPFNQYVMTDQHFILLLNTFEQIVFQFSTNISDLFG